MELLLLIQSTTYSSNVKSQLECKFSKKLNQWHNTLSFMLLYLSFIANILISLWWQSIRIVIPYSYFHGIILVLFDMTSRHCKRKIKQAIHAPFTYLKHVGEGKKLNLQLHNFWDSYEKENMSNIYLEKMCRVSFQHCQI